ncbi:MAG: hypothetical protein ABIK92_21275 [Pseudomonadota bacterium]
MITCSKCQNPIDANRINTNNYLPCPHCNTKLRADVFPAYTRKAPEAEAGQTLIIDDDASCFYHPSKKAVIPCSSCGRFLCSLCDVEMNGEHICFSCITNKKTKGELKDLETHRTLYDSIAIKMAILPLLFLFWITIITAPITIYIVIRYWKKPSSIIERSKIRLIAAFIIATIQIGGWSFFFFNIANK